MITKIFRFYKSQDRVIFYAVLMSIIFALTTPLLVLINFNRLPSRLPLFYSLSWGEQYLVTLNQFMAIPLIVFLILLINLSVSWHLHESQLSLKRALNISTLVIALVFAFTAINIIYIFV